MNVFITKDKRIKLGDLGLSTILQSENIHGNLVGTPLYISPEQIRKQPYGLKIDVWAYGCVLYNLAYLYLPFNGNNIQVLYHNIVNETPKPLNPVFSPRLSRFILRLLEKNCNIRPSIFNALGNIPNSIKSEYRYRLATDYVNVPNNSGSLNESLIAENEQPNCSSTNFERPTTSSADQNTALLWTREKLKTIRQSIEVRSITAIRPSTGFGVNHSSLPVIKPEVLPSARNPLITSLELKRKSKHKKTTVKDLANIV